MPHKELEKLYKQDQADRNNAELLADFEKFTQFDKKRRQKAREIAKDTSAFSARDFYMLAMLYQHGQSIVDSKKAVRFAKKSMEMGYENAKWLFAATTDRLLIKQKRKQRYGTQRFREFKTNHTTLFPVNKKVSDNERLQYNVPPLHKIQEDVDKKNRRVSKRNTSGG